MRKPVSLLLLLILTYNVGGYAVLCGAMLFANEERVEQLRESKAEATLPHSKCPARIVVAISDQQRCDQILKGEFNFNGNLYDVLSTSVCGDSMVVVCIHDGDEENINAHVAERAGEHAHDILLESPVKECSLPILTLAAQHPTSIALFRSDATSLISLPQYILTPPPRG